MRALGLAPLALWALSLSPSAGVSPPPRARAAAPRRSAVRFALDGPRTPAGGGSELSAATAALVLSAPAALAHDTRPTTLSLLDNIAAALVESEADGRLRSGEDERFVDALLGAVRSGRAEQLPLLATSRMGALLTPAYLRLMRERLRAAQASGSGAELGALLELNEFVLSVANSTQSTLSNLHAQQLDKVAALCQAALRGGTPALHALAVQMHEAGRLDADFVNWLALAIASAEGADGELPSQWQLVLKLVRQGTHAILERDYREDVQTLRSVMAIPPAGRRDLLWSTLAELSPDGARHFECTLRRIVGSLQYAREPKSQLLHQEVAELLQAAEQWFDSPFYQG